MATATLRLSRKGRVFDRSRNWRIEIDGKGVGSIANDETIDLQVEPGRHALRLGSSRNFRSPERFFEAADGQVVRFLCHARLIWPELVAALVRPDLWIVLKAQ